MARNSFILGQAGVDIDLVGATIHNYNHDWVGVMGETTPQPGQSVAYGEGDIVFHRDALWVALRANDNIEPSTSAQDWAQIATGSGSTIERWMANPGVYQTDEIVIYLQNNIAQLYIWEGTNPSTPTDVPGVSTDWQQLSGHGGSTLAVNGGVGIIVQPGSNSVTVSLSETVDQAMTFNDTVRVDGNIDSGGNITTSNGTVSSAMASFGQMNSVEANTRTLDVIGDTSTAAIEVAERAIVPRARGGNQAVTLDQLNEAESRIINRAREEFELEPEIDPGHEFRYFRTFENTDANQFDSDARMFPVTLPIGTQISNDSNGEVQITYPTTGQGAGSRSSTGRRLSGTLYTSPGNVTRSAGGVDIPYNSSEAGDTRLIGTAYAGYRPSGTPQIEQELWRHNEMWAVADFEITLNFRHATDPLDSTPRTLTQRWSDIRMNFECWNHNILYHHRSIEGNTNGGDDAITAGPLLNYFAGAIGLQRTVPGGTQTAMPPGMATYMNRGSDGNLFEQTYDGGYIPGSYISIAPNITTNASGNDNAVHERLQVNQSARNFSEFGSNLPDQGNQDMRPLIFTAIPCPWRIISDTITHNYIQGRSATRQFPRADVSEISDSGMFTFTRSEHRNFPLDGEPRYMEPLDTSESRTNAPLIPEVYIEVGTAFGQILDMELEFNMSNVRYVNSITQDGGTRTASTTIASMLPRGTGNQIHNAGTSIWATGQANTGGVGGGRENTSLPPAIFKELTIVGNRPEPVSYDPYAVRSGNGIDVFDYGFLYGGNTLSHTLRAFRAEQTIMPVTHAQAFTGNWVIGDYELAAGTFGAFDQTNTGTQGSQGRHLLMTSRYSRPDPYNMMTSQELFPAVANKLGRHPEQWSSARATDASNPYQAGEVVRSTGFTFALPTTPIADREEDPTRLRLWVARRNARVSGGEIVAADRQGPAHSFENDPFGDPLWFPLSVHAQLAMPYIPIQEDGLRPLSGLEAEYTPGNYTRGRPPTFPGDFENYEITGLPVVYTQEVASGFGQTAALGSWRLRTTEQDRTNNPDGTLGRFNPDVFHFRKAATGEPNLPLSFDPPRSSAGSGDSGNPAFIFCPAPGGVAVPPPTGYINPYECTFVDNITLASDNDGDTSLPNTQTRGTLRVMQNPLIDRQGFNGILHAVPQSNIVPTGRHNRNTPNIQELYMPNLAVDGDPTSGYRWLATESEQPRDSRAGDPTASSSILTPFGWQDHMDFIQIDYQGVDDSGAPVGAPTNTRYTIVSWEPRTGLFRISRVDDGSDTSSDTTEPQWSDTTAPFRNIARYVLGRRAGVDFLQAGTDAATRIAGEVSVIGEDGIEISTNTTEEQLIIGIDPAAFLVGPPDDPLMTPTDTGSPLPFGMFGLIDLFLGQQFSNRVDGMEQTVPDTDFSFFERYRRRGTSYYWYPNRAAVVTSDGTTQFIDRNTMFPPDGTGTRQTDLRLKAPTVFRDLAADNVERSITVAHPPIRGAVFGTTQVRLTWGGTDMDMNPIMAPDVVPGRYYTLTGTNNFDGGTQRIQLLFTSSAVTATDDFNWFLSTDRVVWAPGPDNAWVGGSPNFNMDTVLQHFPEDDFRVFEGIWQNYFGIELPDPDVGEWRVLLEG